MPGSVKSSASPNFSRCKGEDFLRKHWRHGQKAAVSALGTLAPSAANDRYLSSSARSNLCSLMATLSLSALVVHLFKAVVALVVTPIDEDRSMIDTGAILAPSFETNMVGG